MARKKKLEDDVEKAKSQLDTLLDFKTLGVSEFVPDDIMTQIDDTIKDINNTFRANITNSEFSRSTKSRVTSDPDVYTNLKNLFSNNSSFGGEFADILEVLYMKNRKFYSILHDYEMMPVLIPQINRVLEFLVNETISPDIQNDRNFEIKLLNSSTGNLNMQNQINEIRTEMNLDKLYESVINNRYKYHREFYRVVDYTDTFDRIDSIITRRLMNESTVTGVPINDTMVENMFESAISKFTSVIDEASVKIPVTIYRNDTKIDDMEEFTMKNLNIVIERSSIVDVIKETYSQSLVNKYDRDISSMYDSMINEAFSFNDSKSSIMMNEASQKSDKLTSMKQVVESLKKKKLRRCQIDRLDPAKTFPLCIGKDSSRNTIGYLYVENISSRNGDGKAWINNLGRSLKDKLMNSKNIAIQSVSDYKSVEENMAKNIAEKIIKAFDPSIGIDRIEDIDLLHDFIINNEIYNGNKRITFYYKDEIFDFSRSKGSLLVNSVFFTKLYVMMIMNNIITKVLRGRGRQIHTVKLGVSNAPRKYIENAILMLNNPQANIGLIHGSLEALINSVGASSDIIIPTEEDGDRFISTDYIDGQNVDMDTDFLRFLLNSIVTSFGLDNAVLDATNGQIQFAKTLSMESLQICNSVKNEQNDVYPSWKAFCLRVLYLMGDDDLRAAIDANRVDIEFFQPKSLTLQNTMDEINNAKSYAETIADTIPEFNSDNPDNRKRYLFINALMRSKVNIDWTEIDNLLTELGIQSIDEELKEKIEEIKNEYKSNTKNIDKSLTDSDDDYDDEDFGDDDFGGETYGGTDEETDTTNDTAKEPADNNFDDNLPKDNFGDNLEQDTEEE